MQYIDCNINPISRVVSYPGATIVQRDTNVEALRFHFSLDAEYELENDSIRIMVLKDGKTNGFNAENVRVETNDGGDEELVFEHTITTHETATPGQIAISVCGNQVSGNNITEAWHTLNMVFQVASAAHSESDEGEDTPETIASNAEKIAVLQTLVDAITSGRPIPVDLKSKMTDTSAIYLYTGNETGEQHNYWYYHDGTSWVPGSEYGGMTIDDELSSTSENAVQNKVIKANFDEINGRLTQYGDTENLFTETAENVKTWSVTTALAILENTNTRSIVIPCEPSMRYRIRKNAGGRFIVGDFHTYPSAGKTLTNGIIDNNATEIVYTTSRNAQYLVAYVYAGSTDGSDYQAMLDSVVIERATANDMETRKITESVQSGGHTFAYNADLSLLTNEGTGRYFLGEAFPAGNVKSIQLYMKANSEVHFGLYTLENNTLTIARWLVAKSTEDGLVTVPVEATALHPFYVQIYVVSGKVLFRSNGKYDVYGVTAYSDTYDYPLSVEASHYEFGLNVIYTYTKEYEPLGKNWLLIGDSYLEGYTADGNVVSWGKRVRQFLGLDYNIVIKYKGGVGFIPYDFGSGEIGFESLALNANVPDPNTITHIVVCGGYNDAVRSASQGEVGILNRIESFVTNVSAMYPNAKIYIGMIGYRNNDATVLSRIRGAGLRAYQTSVRYGANDKVRYLNNVEWTLVSSDMSSDGYHPNADGQYKLGMNIKNALLTGSAPILSFARDDA